MHPTIAKIQRGNFRKVPEIKTGYTVKVSQKVREGSKERIQNFQGLVIKVSHGTGVEKTFTVRKIVEGIGVEKIFPFHSPNVTAIHVVKKAKVRREKLYYMRERFGKSARLSEKHVTDEERAKEEIKMEALYAEAVKADEKKKADEAETENNAESDTADSPSDEPSAEPVKTDEITEENKAEDNIPSDNQEKSEEDVETEPETKTEEKES